MRLLGAAQSLPAPLASRADQEKAVQGKAAPGRHLQRALGTGLDVGCSGARGLGLSSWRWRKEREQLRGLVPQRAAHVSPGSVFPFPSAS